MRLLARIGSALALVALAAPAAVPAQSPATDGTAVPMPTVTPDASPAPDSTPAVASASAPHRHKKSLFGGRRHCVECQRADALQRYGVNVPPPPPMPGAVMTQGKPCADCGKTMIVMRDVPKAARRSPGASAYAPSDAAPAPPGVAFVGDAAPGMAMVGDAAPGSGPVPIGLFAPGLASTGPAAVGPKSPRDNELAQTGMASDPVSPQHHNRPHILLHTLNLDGMSRARSEREFKKKASHASISYGPTNQNVSELPANVVYGK